MSLDLKIKPRQFVLTSWDKKYDCKGWQTLYSHALYDYAVFLVRERTKFFKLDFSF